MPEQEWFASWFDTPYYHQLYQHRNYEEAAAFIEALLLHLQPRSGARVHDLACGKGRHALQLAKHDLQVIGTDLSEQSIAIAQEQEQANLQFFVQDMRQPFRSNYFDLTLNLFTSFGYFQTDREHLRALKNIAVGLRPEGIFVIDFLNAKWIQQSLQPKGEKEVDGIIFHWEKKIVRGYLEKHIHFQHQGQNFQFMERVRLFTLTELTDLFQAAGLTLTATFGDYALAPFSLEHSERLILQASKSA